MDRATRLCAIAREIVPKCSCLRSGSVAAPSNAVTHGAPRQEDDGAVHHADVVGQPHATHEQHVLQEVHGGAQHEGREQVHVEVVARAPKLSDERKGILRMSQLSPLFIYSTYKLVHLWRTAHFMEKRTRKARTRVHRDTL